MYMIGDSIVYPMHGAGVIEAVEQRKILDHMVEYYVLKLPISTVKVLVPVTSASEAGIRDVISTEEADIIIETFKNCNEVVNPSWTKRYRENMEKIRDGKASEVASVVKSLMYRDKIKKLSTGERKMLITARQILVSELAISKQSSCESIDGILESIIDAQVELQQAN